MSELKIKEIKTTTPVMRRFTELNARDLFRIKEGCNMKVSAGGVGGFNAVDLDNGLLFTCRHDQEVTEMAGELLYGVDRGCPI